MRRTSPAPYLLAVGLLGCNGLKSYNDTAYQQDTGLDIAGPGDTSGIGEPLDTAVDNAPPVADAGDDTEVSVDTVVELDGSLSSDPDGDPLTFYWELTSVPSGSSASFIDEDTEFPSFWPDVPGEFEATLTVDDGVSSDTDVVMITAIENNDAPIADAGSNQTVTVGDSVSLNGSGSSDPDGDSLTFAWTLTAPSGSAATLDDRTSALPRFTTDVVGTYSIELVVSDGTDFSSPDTVRVVAEEDTSDDSDCSCSNTSSNRSAWFWLVLLPVLALRHHRRADAR